MGISLPFTHAVNPCTNELYYYRNKTVKYSGKPKIIPYHSIMTSHNSIHEPKKYHVQNIYNRHYDYMVIPVGILCPYY